MAGTQATHSRLAWAPLGLWALLTHLTLPARAAPPHTTTPSPAPAAAAPSSAPNVPGTPAHHYAIVASVDTARHRVHGELTLRFQNTSRAPLDHLMWHLYPNAFRSEDSVFFREGGAALRRAGLRHPGSLTVTSLEGRGRDLLPDLDVALRAADRTEARLPLDPALAPGQAITLRVGFETQLPEMVARMGYAGEFHMLAQWFPKLAKLEAHGAFASFPYHGAGEFYSDFATYEVTLEVPRRFRAICGGERTAAPAKGALNPLNPPRSPDMRRVRYRLSPAHDIACAVAPDLQVLRSRAHGVNIEVTGPIGFGPAQRRQLDILRFGMGYLQRHVGPYPYRTLRAVIPTAAARAAGGMEYPGLITTGGPGFSLPVSGIDVAHDVVTAHELTHQWFYGLLASDEVSHPILDEGLTEWVTWQLLEARHRATRRAPGWLTPRALLAARGGFATARNRRSALLAAHRYHPRQLGAAVYLRPAMTLETLASVHGQPRVLAALGRYARSHRFGHPSPADLYAAFDAEFGVGFSARALIPRLAGERPLSPSSTRTPHPPTRDAWFATLLFAWQALLRSLGP